MFLSVFSTITSVCVLCNGLFLGQFCKARAKIISQRANSHETLSLFFSVSVFSCWRSGPQLQSVGVLISLSSSSLSLPHFSLFLISLTETQETPRLSSRRSLNDLSPRRTS